MNKTKFGGIKNEKKSSKQTANPTGPCDGPLISIPLVGRRTVKTVNHETPKA